MVTDFLSRFISSLRNLGWTFSALLATPPIAIILTMHSDSPRAFLAHTLDLRCCSPCTVDGNAAIHAANAHAGNGNENAAMFSTALSHVGQMNPNDTHVNEDAVQQHHQQAYGQGQGGNMAAGAMGGCGHLLVEISTRLIRFQRCGDAGAKNVHIWPKWRWQQRWWELTIQGELSTGFFWGQLKRWSRLWVWPCPKLPRCETRFDV